MSQENLSEQNFHIQAPIDTGKIIELVLAAWFTCSSSTGSRRSISRFMYHVNTE